MVFIGHADCGRGWGADRLGLSIMAALVVITGGDTIYDAAVRCAVWSRYVQALYLSAGFG